MDDDLFPPTGPSGASRAGVESSGSGGRRPGATRLGARRPARWSALAGLLLLFLAAACSRPREAVEIPPRPVRIAVHSGPLSLDPHARNELATFSALSNVYEALTTFDPDGQIRPSLAVSWSNPDDLTWRFELRPGVRFHDGSPFGAADVVASLERVRSVSHAEFAPYLVEVRDVEVRDPHTVEIRTFRPYPILLNKLAFILIVPRTAPAAIEDPVGTGPYRWRGALDHGQLVANDSWWGGRPRIREARLIELAEGNERTEALLGGQVDLAARILPAGADRIAATPGARLEERPSLEVEYLGLRVDRSPFDDLRVRQAVHLAIDREERVRRVHGGRAVPLGQMVPEDVFGHHPALTPPGRDLERARELLREAGHGNGLDVVLELRPGRSPETLVEQLGDAGIRVEVREVPWSEVYVRLREGFVEAYLGGLLAVSADASDLLDTAVHSLDPDRGYGLGNTAGYHEPEVDRLIEESGATLDMMIRRDLLQRTMERITEDLAYVPIASPLHLYGVRNPLVWTPRADGMIRVVEMEWGSGSPSEM